MDPNADRYPPDQLRRAGIAVAVVLAALAVWVGRFEMTHDGISYLDMSRALLRGDWRQAINGHWSPLYPWLLALALAIVRPESRLVFPLVHVVNFVIFLAALAAFDFFLRQLLVYRQATSVAADTQRRVPDWAVVALGYVVFVWSSLNLMGMAFVAPDLAVATCVYLAAGWLLRCRMHREQPANFVILGIALGLGYLAKAPMFPIGLVFLIITVLPLPRGLSLPAAARQAAVALIVFLLIAAPLVVALTSAKGRLTLGDSAWLNYLWHVDRLPIIHYQGEFPEFGTPTHPTRQISKDPAAYEFAGPIDATYPPWFAPAYWYDGLTPRFTLWGHLITARWSLRLYDAGDALNHWSPSIAVFALLVVYLGWQGWISRVALRRYVPVWGPAVAAIATYAAIHLESRYVAPFMALLWLGLLCVVSIPPARDARRPALLLFTGVLLFHAGIIAALSGLQVVDTARRVFAPASAPPADIPWRVASGLRQMGLEPGDGVAVIGPGIRAAYWAWLAQLKVVGEVPAWAKRGFWAADDGVRQTILDRFAGAGARAVVNQPNFRSEGREPAVDFTSIGWRRIGDTDYYVLLLKK